VFPCVLVTTYRSIEIPWLKQHLTFLQVQHKYKTVQVGTECVCVKIYVWLQGRPAEIQPGTRMSVFYERCVLLRRSLCDGMITRPEGSCRLWCVVVCGLETSWMRRPWHTGGLSRQKTNKQGSGSWLVQIEGPAANVTTNQCNSGIFLSFHLYLC